MNKYLHILKQHGLKVTTSRIEILKYLNRKAGHPTVDMIYKDLKKKVPSLSRTTIYNNIEQLKEKALICVISIAGKELRYDLNTDPHRHFMCRMCGLIIDLECEDLDMNPLLLGKHRVEEYHGYLKGTCGRCLKKEDSDGTKA